MKTMKKRNIIIVIILCVTLVLSLGTTVAAGQNSDRDIFTEAGVDREKYAKNFESTQAYNAMINYFGQEGSGEINSVTNFPDCYAGAYIDENDSLVILLTKIDDQNVDLFKKATGCEEIIVLKADFSYPTLLAEMNILNEKYVPLEISEKKDMGIVSYGINDKKNRIEVNLLTYNEKQISALKNQLFNSDMIVYKQHEGPLPTPQLYVDSGSQISDEYGNSGTIGYPAKKYFGGSWQYGFVTAGHLISSYEQAQRNGTWVGTGLVSSFGGNCDGAFVTYVGNFTVGPFIHNDTISLVMNAYTTAPVGSTVFKDGDTTGVTSGTITGVNRTITVTDNWGNPIATLTGQSEANYYSAAGDSGGPVYMPRPNGVDAYIVGINVISRGGITPYYNIYSTLGCSIGY